MVSCSIIRFKSHFFFLSLSLSLSYKHTHTLTHFISPSLLHPLKTSKSTHTPNLKKLSVNSSQHASTISFYLSFAHTHTHTDTHTRTFTHFFLPLLPLIPHAMLCKLAFSLFKVWKSERRRKKDCVAPNVAQSSFQRCDSTSQATRNHILQASVPYHKFRGNKRERERERLRGVLFLHLSFEHFRSALEILGGFGSHTHTKISHTLPFVGLRLKNSFFLQCHACLREVQERERKWERERVWERDG